MGFDPRLAIRATPIYAGTTEWTDNFGKVFGVLGFPGRFPTAKEFVTAVHKWQHAHPPLSADGMLGPRTWKRLLPEVQAYKGSTVMGTLPFWATPAQPRPVQNSAAPAPSQPAAQAPLPSPSPPIPPSANSPEDKAIQDLAKEFFRIGQQLDINPLAAVPISPEMAIDNTRLSIPVLPVSGICGTLKVGQVWQGLGGGNRIIVALVPSALQSEGGVTFVTDSGQAYYQTAEGWNSDFVASVYAQVSKNLAPIQTLLEIEAEVLLGAIAASSGAGFVIVNGLGVLQWVLQNRENIGKWKDAFGTFVAGYLALRQLAPTMARTVLLKFMWNAIGDIPESALHNKKLLARYIGIMLVKVGKLILKRDSSVLLECLPPLLKRVLAAMGQVARVAKVPTIVTGIESLPGAVPLAGRDAATSLAAELARFGVDLSGDEAKAIITEIKAHPEEIKNELLKLQEAAKAVQ